MTGKSTEWLIEQHQAMRILVEASDELEHLSNVCHEYGNDKMSSQIADVAGAVIFARERIRDSTNKMLDDAATDSQEQLREALSATLKTLNQ